MLTLLTFTLLYIYFLIPVFRFCASYPSIFVFTMRSDNSSNSSWSSSAFTFEVRVYDVVYNENILLILTRFMFILSIFKPSCFDWSLLCVGKPNEIAHIVSPKKQSLIRHFYSIFNEIYVLIVTSSHKCR